VNSPTVGVYIHIPFCARICPYCDFAVEAVESGKMPSADWADVENTYVDGLLRELARRREVFAGHRLATLYFGGGTPSLLRPDSLARIRSAVEEAFPMPAGAAAGGEVAAEGEAAAEAVEVTLEINPSFLERERLPDFRRETGIGRLSVGVQSFDDSLLKALGRAHRSDEIRRTLTEARAAGFENISIDLIFAALHQTQAMWEADLEQAIALGLRHLSTYELVFETGTPFARAATRGQLRVFPGEESARMMEWMETRLGAAGYRRYELTNFAKPGWESRHNRRYWRRQAVLGLGVGAHSTDPPAPGRPHGARVSNERNRAAWLRRVQRGEPILFDEEVLDRRSAIAEACFLSLRCEEGLDEAAFESEFGQPPRREFGEQIGRLLEQGLLEEAPTSRLRLTSRGRMLADRVCAEFV
jgi:oxygen-independent coproporphyrinogen-3 oxidase